MISAIHPINYTKTYNPNFSAKKREVHNSDEHKNIKNIVKYASIAAGLTAGAIFATKVINAEIMKWCGASVIEKPRIFSEETLDRIANKWVSEGFVNEGDSVVVLPRKAINSLAENDKKYASMVKGMKLSDNAFMVTIMDKNENFKLEEIKYFDPECITFLKMVDALKNDKMFCCAREY